MPPFFFAQRVDFCSQTRQNRTISLTDQVNEQGIETMSKTYYAEATVISTGEIMCDSGLSAAQIEQLRQVEKEGRISGLVVEEDIDIVAAFRNSVNI